ncbi:MAG TPA: MurR/RpiR family transcriptional regulator [Acidimicrobiales bacterium]|nr:MurR/RpiR family transcriptional regulator [Acidimicrobiales bacterium]
MDVAALIEQHQDRLTPAERRVATVVLDQPQLVAFGTVAELARQASTSGASVIRLSTKLGFDGFSSLQDTVQRDLGRQLRPATARIRQPEAGDLLDRALHVELDNVQATLDSVDRDRFDLAVRAIANSATRVFVLVGEASSGIGAQLVSHLSMLRSGVTQLSGSAVRVHRALAELRPGDTVLTIDLPRYDAWLIRAAEAAASRHATVIALSDSVLSPLARCADLHFVVQAKSVGPFDSYLGALALLDALVAGVADALRASATESLDRIEAAWSEAGVLVDE